MTRPEVLRVSGPAAMGHKGSATEHYGVYPASLQAVLGGATPPPRREQRTSHRYFRDSGFTGKLLRGSAEIPSVCGMFDILRDERNEADECCIAMSRLHFRDPCTPSFRAAYSHTRDGRGTY